MVRGALLVGLLLAACDDSNTADFNVSPTPAPTKPKTGGFSADLAKTVGSNETKKPDTVADVKPDKPDKPDVKPDKVEVKPDKPDVKPDVKPDKVEVKPDVKPDKPDVKPDKPDTKREKTDNIVDTKPEKPIDNGKPAGKTANAVAVPINLAAPRNPVKPSAEVAAIRLSLEPNWDRDVGEAGTISLVVRVPNREETRVFAFRYGYEDPKAPTDREQYKAWLTENHILKPSLDRQRGSAWYLEGTDANGAPAFLTVVIYSGKKLICGGSLYKDAASNQLGDIRDKTLIQAKEICETLQL
jgi:hypothetical protein